MAYAVEKVESILESVFRQLEDGESLISICKQKGYPTKETIWSWVKDSPIHYARYMRARQAQADGVVDKMHEVERRVSEGTLDAGAARVMLESMRWRAAKLAPKVYGDRLDVSVQDNRISISGALQAAQARLADVVDVTPRIAQQHNSDDVQ